MIAMLFRKLALTLILAFAGMALLERFNPAPPPMLVEASLRKADFPVCVRIVPPPLLRAPRGRLDYQPGVRFNDKGVS